VANNPLNRTDPTGEFALALPLLAALEDAIVGAGATVTLIQAINNLINPAVKEAGDAPAKNAKNEDASAKPKRDGETTKSPAAPAAANPASAHDQTATPPPPPTNDEGNGPGEGKDRREYSKHAREKMRERRVRETDVEEAVANPSRVIKQESGVM
jgi:hypothetical protein